MNTPHTNRLPHSTPDTNTNMCTFTWDQAFDLLALGGAIIGFLIGLQQWRRGQSWQRAQKLDEFITKFETNELLRLGSLVLDWTSRRTQFREMPFLFSNLDALKATKIHTEPPDTIFSSEQAALRDAYDALLTFFERLEISIATGLIDADPTRHYFGYWLKRLVRFDMHPTDSSALPDGYSAQSAMRAYIRTYANEGAVRALCARFGIAFDG